MKTRSERAWSEKALTHHRSTKFGLVAAMLMASVGGAAAQEQYPAGAGLYYSPPPLNEHRSAAVSRWDRWRFHRSGTRGRQGLGASPYRPEGPGNISE